jgi:hypothetical protein
MLIVKPIGGLCNRIRVIKSLIALNKNGGGKVLVLWEKNNELFASYNTLLQNIPNIKIITTTAIQTKFIILLFKNIFRYNYINKTQLLENFTRTNRIEDIFFLNTNTIIETGIDFFMPNFNSDSFRLTLPLQSKLNQFINQYNISETIGVHIRRTDNSVAIQKSPLILFHQAIEKEINENKTLKFFLASDDDEVIKEFQQKYPSKIITFAQNKRRTEQQGIEDAILELFMLSKTKKIYGTYWSSFSEMAIQLNKNTESKLLIK